MTDRLIAIGDIHGCCKALSVLLGTIAPTPNDTVVTLGDYIDRGPDTRGVLDQLIELRKHCRLVSILGNHEELMLAARGGESDLESWLRCGGDTALDSYGNGRTIGLIPREHFEFVESCLEYFETETHFFVHANYRPNFRLEEENGLTRRWKPIDENECTAPHYSGKIAVLGHTPQPEILDLGHLICIDTGCCDGGWLTAMDVISGQVWQVDQHGNPRSTSAGSVRVGL
ncbi:MAG: serine/threonine protein phosphatase [Planctomycetota bacterium]|nr:MAG: serine/threonine protein phosphatase [Planctomycetota bacterium]REK49374.1 MAG: serine/threonine protein phosphatase [Planctomycetota bacterium]